MDDKILKISPPYQDLSEVYTLCSLHNVYLDDHLMGFDSSRRNVLLDYLDNRAKADGRTLEISVDYDPRPFSSNYKNLIIKASTYNNKAQFFKDYKNPPDVNFKNFVCSFNGTAHVSRRLLTAHLKKYNWFNPEYGSQCFTSTPEKIDGLVRSLVPDDERYYRKFFVPDTELGENSISYDRFKHFDNVKMLEIPLTCSFLHIVSESMATSYAPLPSEKCYYSIATRGLFLAFGQPGWHKLLKDNFGFKLYSRLFDYNFDEIENPIKRLIELTSMISKFSYLSMSDLHDLYLLEADTIEFNYDHYHTNNYMTHVTKIIENYNASL